VEDLRVAERVGGAALLALGLATALVLLLSGRHLVPGMRLHVEIKRIGALQPGAPMRMAALEVGTVEAIDLRARPEGPIAVLDVWVNRRHAWLLRETTDFFLSQQGLLGETYLEVAARPGAPGPGLTEGQTVRAVDPPNIDTLLATSYENLLAAKALFNEGLPELAALHLALDGLERTVDGLDPPRPARAAAWSASLELLAQGRALAVEGPPAGDVRADGRALGASLTAARGSLAARVARLSDALRPLLAHSADARLRRLGEALDRAGPIVEGAEKARAQAELLGSLLASGTGTLGALLQEVELADELKDMTRTMKRQPWRVLFH
jgi:phospholipid/cholesterol/gamma-HCH transport system substrate-binding protein